MLTVRCCSAGAGRRPMSRRGWRGPGCRSPLLVGSARTATANWHAEHWPRPGSMCGRPPTRTGPPGPASCWLQPTASGTCSSTPVRALRSLMTTCQIRPASHGCTCPAGVRTSVDPASAAPLRDLGADRFAELIGGVQLLLPNADEAAVLTGVADPAAAAGSLLSIAETVVVTLGDLGALHADRSGASHRVPSVQPPGPVLDSTGAGDAFAAGWIAAHLRGDGAPQCLAAGARAGAVAVTLPGGRPPDAPPVGFSRSAG